MLDDEGLRSLKKLAIGVHDSVLLAITGEDAEGRDAFMGRLFHLADGDRGRANLVVVARDSDQRANEHDDACKEKYDLCQHLERALPH